MRELKLTVTIDEANLILEGLGQMPFARVYGLVAKLQEQASGQIGQGEDTPARLLKEAGGAEGHGGG